MRCIPFPKPGSRWISFGRFFHTFDKNNPMKRLTFLSVAILLSIPMAAQKTDYDKKLKDLGIELFAPPKPMANYVRAVRTGNLVYLAGHGQTKQDGRNIPVKVGKDIT